MALPKAAQKQIKDAEKLHAEVYGKEGEQPKLEEVKDERPEPTQDPATAASGDEAGDNPVPEVPQDQGDRQASEPESVQSPEPTPDKGQEKVDWEHKYSVLKGKYDAEVPRLQQQNNAMQGQIVDLQNQMNDILTKGFDIDEDGEKITPGKYLKEDEVEDYGADMIDVVKRAAREEFEPMLAKLQEENSHLRGLLGGMQQQTATNAKQTMLTQLDEQIPQWREVNGNQEFLGWLENVDPYSGQKKLDMLRQAFEGNNTQRVMAFFRGFLNENAAFTTSQQPNPSEPKVSMETLVAPGRASDGDQPRAQEGNTVNGKVWTSADVSKFYRDVQRGVFKNDPAERDRLERDIFLAQKQGRIAP